MSHPHSHGGCVTLLDTPTSHSLMQGAAGTYRLLLLIIMLVSAWQLVPDLEPLVMSEQHDLDLRNWICSSTLSFHYSAYLILVVQHQQSSPSAAFEVFLSPRMMSPHHRSPTDITQLDKNGERTRFTFVFISHPSARNQAVRQWHNCAANCWQWSDIMHSGTVEKKKKIWAVASLFFFSFLLKHQTVMAKMDVARHH